jgi:hypothetical protein
MIDRTTFDLRIAEHQGAVAQANRHEWQFQGTMPFRSLCGALAQALIVLASRLDPAVLGRETGTRPASTAAQA